MTDNDPVIAPINARISAFSSMLDGSAYSLLSTADGSPVASNIDCGESADTQASIACALLSLTEAFSIQVLGSPNQETVLQCATGSAVIVRIRRRDETFLFCTHCDQSVNVGTLLRGARDTAREIEKLLHRGGSINS